MVDGIRKKFLLGIIGPQEIKFILVYFYDMQLENIKLPFVPLVHLVPLLYLLYLLPECP